MYYVENEHADAGREDRTCFARQNSQARTGTGKYTPYSFFLFCWPRAGFWLPYPVEQQSTPLQVMAVLG